MISAKKTAGVFMGGLGSGNRWQSGKHTTSYMRRLDIRRIQHDGLLVPGNVFRWCWSRNGEQVASINIRVAEDALFLNYRCRSDGGDWEDMSFPVALDWTACHMGGRRVWFRCPGCGRRVAILYGGKTFACRHCHNLAYDSQRESPEWRAQSRALKIRARLGWENEHGSKPKGMHWRTFERLKRKQELFAATSIMMLAERLRIVPKGC
ncbi:MAG: hypothetical protein LBQ51_01695 [Desulfovibrio sp.]|nr:hypothetical protein [Desulfovibrio sp.]